uniref:Uncharacterized protein n=1 Tax=Rhizophora mucronata TaxID=61149 RepID=A0A2P2NZT0_RHIMU
MLRPRCSLLIHLLLLPWLHLQYHQTMRAANPVSLHHQRRQDASRH